jgi:hypothetical protein
LRSDRDNSLGPLIGGSWDSQSVFSSRGFLGIYSGHCDRMDGVARDGVREWCNLLSRCLQNHHSVDIPLLTQIQASFCRAFVWCRWWGWTVVIIIIPVSDKSVGEGKSPPGGEVERVGVRYGFAGGGHACFSPAAESSNGVVES